eukprot:811807-Prymnesium_polylepis.1
MARRASDCEYPWHRDLGTWELRGGGVTLLPCYLLLVPLNRTPEPPRSRNTERRALCGPRMRRRGRGGGRVAPHEIDCVCVIPSATLATRLLYGQALG